MAAYATTDDVRLVVARDQDKARSTAELGDDQLDAAIEDAQAQVDGYLRGSYETPFDPVPALVKSLTVDIACYLAGLNYYQETELLASAPLALRYARAIALLTDISMGKIQLDNGDGGEPALDADSGIGQPINPYTGNLFGLSDFGLGLGYGHPGPSWCDW